MTTATKHQFEFPTSEGTLNITSVVMDDNEFEETVTSFENRVKIINSADDQQQAAFNKLREKKHIPLIKRGNSTEEFFTKYEITTQYACVIVRGTGPTIFEELLKT